MHYIDCHRLTFTCYIFYYLPFSYSIFLFFLHLIFTFRTLRHTEVLSERQNIHNSCSQQQRKCDWLSASAGRTKRYSERKSLYPPSETAQSE